MHFNTPQKTLDIVCSGYAISQMIKWHNVNVHVQVRGQLKTADITCASLNHLTDCPRNIRVWMCNNYLKLHDEDKPKLWLLLPILKETKLHAAKQIRSEAERLPHR